MFIVFEGLDGSGKSTLMKSLSQALTDQGQKFILTREPGGSALGDEIRHLLLRTDGDAPVPRAELLLYEAARAQHVDKVIKPALERKDWVLCDRYSASSVAFQCGGRRIPEEEVNWLNSYATAGLEPDLYILIDLPVSVSRKRQQQREMQLGQEADRLESEKDQFHENVRKHYLKLAHADAKRWIVLDGENSPEKLFETLKTFMKEKQWLS